MLHFGWMIDNSVRNCAASVLYIIQSSLKRRIEFSIIKTVEFFIVNLISWNSVGTTFADLYALLKL